VQQAPVQSRTFRLPKSAYLAVLFLVFCALPLAFAGDAGEGAKAVYGPRMLFLLIPIVAIVFIARTATIVAEDGIRVRAAFGSRRLRWDELRGLSIEGGSVYGVVADGAVRLPCVRIGDLASVSRLSGGRLPEVPEPTPKYAPSRRSRRR
jgi:PH (Pleckstrin Homology) domain-containing protein